MNREDGYYWITLKNAPEPSTIGSWLQDFGMWQTLYWDGYFKDSEVTVISERLVPPIK